MRVLIANHHGGLLGGIETYLAAVIPALVAEGCEVLFATEAPINKREELIPLPPGVQFIENDWPAAWKWKPQIVYAHSIDRLELLQDLIRDFPTVIFAHAYFGLCISGTKTWKRAPACPCSKPFDWKCLLYFHIQSCGGKSPITMLRDYQRQKKQLDLLHRCDALLTHGGQMHREYLQQGVREEHLFALPHFVPRPSVEPNQVKEKHAEVSLIFVGRFDVLKGGALLIEALPEIAAALKKPILLRMVGSGPATAEWKTLASRISTTNIRVEFSGWLNRDDKDRLIAQSDLIVVPSLWPEPFGQVGLEANWLGVPAVAYNVGGIPNWLRNGVNGHLAESNPPTPGALARAIVKALEKPEHYSRLSKGAKTVAAEFSLQRHSRALMAVFDTVLQRRPKE